MTIAESFKAFFNALTGQQPEGLVIADVVKSGTANTTNITTLASTVSSLNAEAVKYSDATNKSFVLNSSTEGSVKQFRITVDDSGALTATEIVEQG